MAKLLIDGAEYDFDMDFDLGEARIIKRYSGLNLRELEDHDPSDPDLVAAMVHVALRRQDPAGKFEDIEGKVNAVKLATLSFEGDGSDADPPASAPSSGATTTGEG